MENDFRKAIQILIVEKRVNKQFSLNYGFDMVRRKKREREIRSISTTGCLSCSMYIDVDSPLSSPGEKACLIFRKKRSNNRKGMFSYKIPYIEKVFQL